MSTDTLHFLWLPAYARYLLERRLEEYAKMQLQFSKETNLPLLKHFTEYSDEQLLELGRQTLATFLSALASNNTRTYLDHSLQNWLDNQSSIVKTDQVVAEDITSISLMRRKTMCFFLADYTSDAVTIINIINELDRYTAVFEKEIFSAYLSLQNNEIREMNVALAATNTQLSEAQEIGRMGHFEWNIGTSKNTVSPFLYRLFEMEEGAKLDSFMEGVHPEDRGKVAEAIERSFQNGTYECEYRFCKSGPEKVLWSRGLVTFENGKPVNMKGTVVDVTDWYELNRELKEREENIQQLIVNAPDSVIVLDENGKIILWNPKATDIFGWHEQEVLGIDVSELIIPHRYRNAHKQGMERLRNTGKSRVLNTSLELSALNKEGDEFYISLVISKSTRHGKDIFISFIRDISNEKTTQLELEKKSEELIALNIFLEQKNTELEQKNRELESFNYAISHDLQEPLRKIQVFTSMLKDGYTEMEEAMKLSTIERINASAQRLRQLISDLFSFSFLIPSTDDQLITSDLNEIVRQVRDDYQMIITEKRVVLDADNLPVVHARGTHMYQLFQNLVSNAIKYARENIAPHIVITSDLVPGTYIGGRAAMYHRIMVVDNGIGFDEQYSNRIFDLFQRLHNKKEYSGTGIGLAVCKKIVAFYNGHILVHSEPGKGSSFTVYLPIAETES